MDSVEVLKLRRCYCNLTNAPVDARCAGGERIGSDSIEQFFKHLSIKAVFSLPFVRRRQLAADSDGRVDIGDVVILTVAMDGSQVIAE